MELTKSKSNLEGQPLFVQPKATSSQNTMEKSQNINLTEIVNSKLMYCPREEQLGVLYRILQPPIIEVDKLYRAITWDLMIVLNKLGLYCKFHQMGSTFTGLAFRGKCFNFQSPTNPLICLSFK